MRRKDKKNSYLCSLQKKEFMKRFNIILLCGCVIFGIVSCKKNRFEIADTGFEQVKIERFDRDLMSIDTARIVEQIAELREKYGDFFALYTEKIIPIGNETSPNYYPLIKGFVNDSMVREIYNEAQLCLGDMSDIERELTIAFGYIRRYFPNIEIPRVLIHISGFNYNIVLADGFLSVGEDFYLGDDYEPYLYLENLYEYQRRNMYREKIAPNYVYGFLVGEFPMDVFSTRLLENMLYRGKIMYLQTVIMPNQPQHVLFGFTPETLQWCKDNEQQMWLYILEKRHLFVNDMFTVAKYLNEAPFTSFFGNESPGQAAVWLGYRIVKQYMDNNTHITLPELMSETDYQKILEQSKYKP